ncbi:MAG: GerW family sporulation protein [Oscillospiraceae bacterium]|nr:GerW family sporulation protein [Oscillospiraceae bacterium]
MNHPLSDMIGATMEKLQTLVDTNTVIGDPVVTADGTTVIPVVKVNYGIAGGGSDFTTKSQKAEAANPFGGGAGAAVTVTPIAFLIIRDGITRMVPVTEPVSTTMDRLIEKVPEFVDKIMAFLNERKAN